MESHATRRRDRYGSLRPSVKSLKRHLLSQHGLSYNSFRNCSKTFAGPPERLVRAQEALYRDRRKPAMRRHRHQGRIVGHVMIGTCTGIPAIKPGGGRRRHLDQTCPALRPGPRHHKLGRFAESTAAGQVARAALFTATRCIVWTRLHPRHWSGEAELPELSHMQL